MSTVIYPSPIFGPIHSRRLGISLGINLLPDNGKACTFDCIYCECGFNKDHHPSHSLPTAQQVSQALEKQLQKMQTEGTIPDVLTFAGNGEPTLHPQFAQIIDETIRLRNRYFPNAKVSVLSNSTFIHRKEVRNALMKVDNNILKLDTVDPEYIQVIDRPVSKMFDIKKIIHYLKTFDGHVIIQTMFMKGHTADGINVDNTGQQFVTPWIDALKQIKPKEVMIYTIDRETPDTHLQKATPQELDAIKAQVIRAGFACQASY